MRRVLILAYFFPPLGGAGVQRTAKFVKYLPQFGWEPTVITTRSDWYPARDPSLADDIPPETRVVKALDPGILRRLSPYASIVSRRIGELLRWPDEMASWIPFAVVAALREIRRARPDVIFSTAAPFSSHLAGRIVSRLTGIPLVTDFRDEWVSNVERSPFAAPLQSFAERAERAVATTAAAVVVTSPAARIADGAVPTVTITNGVDPDDLSATPPAAGDSFRLTFVGTMYGDRDCAPVLAALRRLASDGRIDPNRSEFRVVGNVWLPSPPDAGAVPVTTSGYVSHAEAIVEMHAASALVAYIPAATRGIPGKLFEYLATGVPVLYVAGTSNPGSELVRELDAGVVAEPDVENLERAIRELWDRWTHGTLEADAGERRERALERFSRVRLTEQLAGILDQAARRR